MPTKLVRICLFPEAVVQTCSVEEVVLEILPNFINKQALAQVFSVNFAKFLKTPFLLQNTSSGCFYYFQLRQFKNVPGNLKNISFICYIRLCFGVCLHVIASQSTQVCSLLQNTWRRKIRVLRLLSLRFQRIKPTRYRFKRGQDFLGTNRLK